MKKYLRIAISVGIIILPVLVLAQIGITPTLPPAETLDVGRIIDRIFGWAFGLLIALAGIFILVGAYFYLTSGGEEDKIKKAKEYLLYALIAVVIGALARGMVYIVRTLILQ
jgi:hypothetical protein